MSNSGDKQQNIEATPEMLSLSIIFMACTHLGHIEKTAKESGFKIKHHQKVQLFLELLSSYYLYITLQVMKFFSKEESRLFLRQTYQFLLDNLSKNRDTLWLYGFNPLGRSSKEKEILANLHRIITENDRFYLRDDLTEEEKSNLQQLKNIFGGKDAKTDNDSIDLMMKYFYKILQALGLNDLQSQFAPHITTLMTLYIVSANFWIEIQKNVIQNIKPVWKTKE